MKQVIVLVAMVVLGLSLFSLITGMQESAQTVVTDAKGDIADLVTP